MDRWLYLTVSESPSSKPRVHISVPKRIVRLAVARNRIKRVLREAVKLDAFFNQNQVCFVRVQRLPLKVNLETARKALQMLHD